MPGFAQRSKTSGLVIELPKAIIPLDAIGIEGPAGTDASGGTGPGYALPEGDVLFASWANPRTPCESRSSPPKPSAARARPPGARTRALAGPGEDSRELPDTPADPPRVAPGPRSSTPHRACA